MNRARQFLLLLLAVFLAPLFVLAQMPDRQQGGYPGGPPSATPSAPDTPSPAAIPVRSRVVYITDFELDSAVESADSNQAAAVASQANGSAPVSSSPQTNPPAARAQHIVKLMSDELAKDLKKAGYTTKLLRPSDPRPDDGFLITGIFAHVGPDNRLRRAIFSSGQGGDALQLYVAVQDFAHFTPPLYQPDLTEATATKAGSAIQMNPNAEPVKFSMESDLTDKIVKQTAQRISAELAKRIDAAAKSGYEPLNKYAKP